MATQEKILSEQDTFPVEVFIRRNCEDPMRQTRTGMTALKFFTC